jgi:hypothetical protein
MNDYPEIGSLSVLNTGAGDIVVTFNEHDDAETDRAITMLLDMQKRGYAILVRQDDGSYSRATSINRETKSYVIGKLIPVDETTTEDGVPATKAKRGRRRLEQPVKGRRAVGVARSAGGCAKQSPLALLAEARKA